MVAAIRRRLGVEVPAVSLYEGSTVKALAELVARARGDEPAAGERRTVAELLEETTLYRFDLTDGHVLERGHCYVFPLLEQIREQSKGAGEGIKWILENATQSSPHQPKQQKPNEKPDGKEKGKPEDAVKTLTRSIPKSSMRSTRQARRASKAISSAGAFAACGPAYRACRRTST